MESQSICGACLCWSHSIFVVALILPDVLLLILSFSTLPLQSVIKESSTHIIKQMKTKPTINTTNQGPIEINSVHHNPHVKTYGVFQKYSSGVLNPAFTWMILWDYLSHQNLSEYKICKFHSIKRRIILYGNKAFVFTSLSNNDMQSYIKILLHNKSLPCSMTKSSSTKLIVNYIRTNCRNQIIPCLHSIQNYLKDIVGLSITTFVGDKNTFYTLLHRIYIFMYMLHYHMPLQRKNNPG